MRRLQIPPPAATKRDLIEKVQNIDFVKQEVTPPVARLNADGPLKVTQPLIAEKPRLQQASAPRKVISIIAPSHPEMLPSVEASIDRALAGTPPALKRTFKNAFIEPTLRAYSEFIINLGDRILKIDPAEKVDFLAHMLAIIASESRGNPLNAAIEKDKRGKRYVGAFGYFQFRKRTWNDMLARVLPDSGLRSFVKNSGLANFLSRSFKITPLEFLNPDADIHRSPNALPVYQFLPMLAFSYDASTNVRRFWRFDKDGWHLKIKPELRGPNYDTFMKVSRPYLSDYHRGLQAIMTANHTNGAGFWQVDANPFEYSSRIKEDVEHYDRIIVDPGFKQLLTYAKAMPMFIKNSLASANVMTGDPSSSLSFSIDEGSGITKVVNDDILGASYCLVYSANSLLVAPINMRVGFVHRDSSSGATLVSATLPDARKLQLTLSKEWKLIPNLNSIKAGHPVYLSNGETIAFPTTEEAVIRVSILDADNNRYPDVCDGLDATGLQLGDLFGIPQL